MVCCFYSRNKCSRNKKKKQKKCLKLLLKRKDYDVLGFTLYFQLGLEKAWFTNFLELSVDRPNTTHKLLIMWKVTLEFVWTTCFFPATVFGHKLSFDWANLTFAALSLTLVKVIHALVVFISCGLCCCWCWW